MKLWEEILERPDDLVNLYEYLWNEQHIDKKKYFFKIREIFNSIQLTNPIIYYIY